MAAPGSEFDEFVAHIEEIERNIYPDSNVRNICLGSAAATGDENMAKEPVLDAKRSSRESTPEIGTPSIAAKRRHHGPPATPSCTTRGDVFAHMLPRRPRSPDNASDSGTSIDMWKNIPRTQKKRMERAGV